MPRTPTEVRPALRIALKAYSAQQANRHGRRQQRSGLGMRTDLEEPAFRREDRDVAIIPGAATAPAHRGLGQPAEQQLLVPETTMPLRLSPLVGECLPSISGRYLLQGGWVCVASCCCARQDLTPGSDSRAEAQHTHTHLLGALSCPALAVLSPLPVRTWQSAVDTSTVLYHKIPTLKQS